MMVLKTASRAGMVARTVLAVAGALTGGTALIGTAAAQATPPLSDPTGIIADFNAETLDSVLESAGYTVVELSDGAGVVLGVERRDGAIIYLRPRVCLPEATDGAIRCVGLQTFVLFDGRATAQSVAAFNGRYPFASAGARANGGHYLSRYDIADYGMARGNLALIVANFFHLAGVFHETVTFTTQTVSADGYADDLKARSLNAAALMAVSDRLFEDTIPRHRGGYELDGGELFRLGVSPTGSATPPPEKISN